jgi:hypothetical protein
VSGPCNGVEKTLELLESLKSAVRDFAAREEKLNEEFRTRIAALRYRRDEALGELNRKSSVEIEQADSSLEAARAKAESKFTARKSRISEAHRASKKQMLDAIENKEGGRKHKLQTETLQAKRNHEAGLAAAEAAFLEFQNELAAEDETLVRLETKARNSFKGYWKFRRLLSRARALTEPDLAPDEYRLMTGLRELLRQAGDDLDRFRQLLLPAVFRYLPVWLVLVLGQLPLAWLLRHFGIQSFTFRQAGASVAGCLVAGFILHQFGKRQGETLARAIASALGRARRMHDACPAISEARYRQEIERVESEFQSLSDRSSMTLSFMSASSWPLGSLRPEY